MVKLQFYIGLNDGYGPHKVGIFKNLSVQFV